MNLPDLTAAYEDPRALAELNQGLESMDAEARIAWAFEVLPPVHAMSSSFGAQAAVSLHLLTRFRPDLPVILVDTGYLFAETHQFVEQLRDRLQLRLHTARADLPAAEQERRYGKLWEQGRAGLDHYHRINKIEPMRKALGELEVRSWFAGLRRAQSRSRAQRQVLEIQHGRWKIHPIIDWSDREVGRYLARHQLPWHPLWAKGYVSIGDTHSTRPWAPDLLPEQTRFGGLKRECGLHLEV